MNDTQNQSRFLAICPKCSAHLKIKQQKLGKKVACPRCQHAFVASATIEPSGTTDLKRNGNHRAPAVESEERIDARCPACHCVLNVRKSFVGHQVRCRFCDEVFRVDASDDSVAHPENAASRTEPERLDVEDERERLFIADHLLVADCGGPKSDELEVRNGQPNASGPFEQASRSWETAAADDPAEQMTKDQPPNDEIRLLAERNATQGVGQVEAEHLRAEVKAVAVRLEAERREFQTELRRCQDQFADLQREHERLQEEHGRLREAYAFVRGGSSLSDPQDSPTAKFIQAEPARAGQDEMVLPVEMDTAEASGEALPTLDERRKADERQEELVGLHAQVADLRNQLADSEQRGREMAAVLGAMGIWPRPNRG